MSKQTGILLLNIGTPNAPTEQALKTFLSEFLSDPYVVDYPRLLWLPILNQIILRTRPKKSARLYERIWQASGSPLLSTTASISGKLSLSFPKAHIRIAMRYGKPSIENAILELHEKGVRHLMLFPLFPQYSSSTTQTALEAAHEKIGSIAAFESVSAIYHYFDHPSYIDALAQSISSLWENNGKAEKILFSFHGVPKRYISIKNEPYEDQCKATAQLLARKLDLSSSEYLVSFQSRFGPEPWLLPYTDKTLQQLGEAACDSLQVVCPGFSVDCLETLEEIALQGRKIYSQAGGRNFQYVPALNDSAPHISALEAIISDSLAK